MPPFFISTKVILKSYYYLIVANKYLAYNYIISEVLLWAINS